MSKFAKNVKKEKEMSKEKRVVNYMNGISFKMDPITTLSMVAASGILGEPQYYRRGKEECVNRFNEMPKEYEDFFNIFPIFKENPTEYMEKVIDNALDYDFKATLKIAKELRKDYFMRLNPQAIMVRAAIHPKRAEFCEKNPGEFREIQQKVMQRADEPSMQLAYYLHLNQNNKKGIPSILKRSWSDKLSNLTAYEVAKYKNAEVGMIDAVRVCHASSPVIDELMKTGNVEVKESEKTWENFKSEGLTWKQIFTETEYKMPHMALLRNLRGIAKELNEVEDVELMEKLLKRLVKGVEKGKQFPFRYYSAYKAVEKEKNLNFKVRILEAIEDCLQESLKNMPKLKGKTMVLSDNSGSAWGTLNSEYGTVKIAEIGNLSAVLTAMRCDEGYVGVFGDDLKIVPIKKNSSVLDNLKTVNEEGRTVGMSTESGIWKFFYGAIKDNVHYDNVFIYSDMQAGYGELYCDCEDSKEYVEYFKNTGLNSKTRISKVYQHVDVLTLVNHYRKSVNKKLNVFSVQTAGYDNNVLPQNTYRTSIMYGWTGKEVVFAKHVINLWNDIETNKEAK